MKELLQVSQMAGKNVPDDILISLLSRMPVKTLLRFRLMSKYWYARLSSPEFIKLHTRSLAKDENHMHHKVCFVCDEKEDDLRNCSLPDLLNNHGLMETTHMDYPICTGAYAVHLVGSANGLICSSDYGHENSVSYFVWNPAICKLKILPPLAQNPQNFGFPFNRRYGFGFDEKNGDYKVVVFLPYRVRAEIHIYSMKSDSWRKLEGFPDSYVDEYPGNCLNGKLYWLSSSSDKEYPNPSRRLLDGVSSLDLADETWGKLELPIAEKDKLFMLGILSGELCLLSIRFTEVLLWTREDEVEASWMCMCHLDQVFNFEHERYELRPPFFKSNAGKIFLTMESKFVVLNLDDNSCIQHEINSGIYYAEIYCESLENPLLIAANQDLDREVSPIPEPGVLWVDQLGRNVNENHLREIFGNFGEIVSVQFPIDHVVNRPKGSAYVKFRTRAAAENAELHMDGGQSDGKVVHAKLIASSARAVTTSSRRDALRTDDIDVEKGGRKRRQELSLRQNAASPSRRSAIERRSPRSEPDVPASRRPDSPHHSRRYQMSPRRSPRRTRVVEALPLALQR